MKASDVMSVPVATVSAEATIAEAARILLERQVSGAPVVNDEGRLVGIVTEGDLFRRFEIGTEPDPQQQSPGCLLYPETARRYMIAHGQRVTDVMSRDVVRVSEDTPLARVAALLDVKKIKRVPVMRDGKIIGIVSRTDLLRALVRTADASRTDCPRFES
jgi:CBS domain-containing protein